MLCVSVLTRVHVLDATTKMSDDKPAESMDAARVVQAETDSDAGARTKNGGVGAAMTTAARLNQEEDDDNA